MEIPQFPVDVHGGARGSGLPITAIRAVTPSMQVKASYQSARDSDGGAPRIPADDQMTHRTAIILSYVSVVPNVQPTYSLPALHYFLSPALLCLSSPCRGGI